MPKPSDAGPVLRPVIPPRNLTREIAERIADHIASAKLMPGAKLPTEQEMVAAMGVSRTVVREAVAALRADGLVVTRQGAGAFVAPDAERRRALRTRRFAVARWIGSEFRRQSFVEDAHAAEFLIPLLKQVFRGMMTQFTQVA